MTARHIAHSFDRALAPTGLRSTQFALLRHLLRIGPSGVQALAEHARMDRTTAGRNLRPLERDGLVSIAVDPADRRGRLLALTARGRRLLAQAEPLWSVAQERLESKFGPERTRQLHLVLSSMVEIDFSLP